MKHLHSLSFTVAFLCLVVSLFIGFDLNAQNAGFIGKKYSAGVFLNVSPAIMGTTPSNNGFNRYEKNSASFGVHRMVGAYFSAAIPRNREVVINYERFTTGMLMEAVTPVSGINNRSTVVHDLFYHLTANTLHLQMRYYRTGKGAIAPVGAYIGVGLRASMVNGEIADKRSTQEGEYVGTNHQPLNIDDSFFFAVFTLELGKKTAITERLILGGSIIGGVPLTFPGLLNYYYYDPRDEPELHTKYEFIYESSARMALYNLFQFRTSLSYLLF